MGRVIQWACCYTKGLPWTCSADIQCLRYWLVVQVVIHVITPVSQDSSPVLPPAYATNDPPGCPVITSISIFSWGTLKLMSDIKPQIKEVQRTPSRTNTPQSKQTKKLLHLAISFQIKKKKDLEKNTKRSQRKKNTLSIEENSYNYSTFDFPSKTM